MPTLARDTTSHRAAHDIVMQVVVRIANLALGAVVTALVVRTLGENGYGQWSTGFVTLGLIGYFANFGMEGVVLREAARDPEHEHEWIGAAMMLRLAVLLPVMLISFGSILLLHRSHEMLIAGAILVVAMPFGGVGALGMLFQLRVDNRVPMFILTLRSVLWGIAVVVIYLEHGGMIALAIAMVSTNAVGSIVQVVLALKLVERVPRPSRKRIREVVRVGLPIGISGVLIISYARVDQVIVYSVVGTQRGGPVRLGLQPARPGALRADLRPDDARAGDRRVLAGESRAAAAHGATDGGAAGDHLAGRARVRDRRLDARRAPDLRPAVRARRARAAGARRGVRVHLLRLPQRQPARRPRPAAATAVDQRDRAGGQRLREPDPRAARGLHGGGVDDAGDGGRRMRGQPPVDHARARAAAAQARTDGPDGARGRAAGGRARRAAAGARAAGALVAAACVCYPALLFGLRACGPEDVRVLLRRGTPA